MRFVHCEPPAEPKDLQIREGEMPEPKAGQIRIKIAYAGVNRPDLLQRAGAYPAPPDASPVLGLECAGVIDACGEGVKREIGEEVCALLPGGGYAEYAVCDARHALPVPKGLSMREAAGLPETAFTVWTNVFDRAGLGAGENFLVHGGASGIGTMAIQMAKAMGANVWATAGGAEKAAACSRLGAECFDYKAQDFQAELKAVGRKMDVILDMVGGDYIAKNISALGTEGRLVNIAYLKGSKAEVNFMPIMLKRLKVMGSTLRPQSDDAKAAIAQNLLTHIWPKIAAGEIKPVIDREFALEEVAQAHDYLDTGAHIGKVVLRVS